MKRTTKTSMTLIGLLGLCLVASTASAGSFYAKAECVPTQVGYEIRAVGEAKVSDGVAQHLTVDVSADLKDGTVLVVSATAKSGESFDIGSVSMLMGSAKLALDSLRNGSSPAFPVEELESITINYKNVAALVGKFIPGSNTWTREIRYQADSPNRPIQMK